MNMKINSENLDKTILAVFDEYKDLVFDDMKEAVDETSKQLLKDIRGNIDSEGLVDTGKYKRSWRSRVDKSGNAFGYKKIAYSYKYAPLTHLLEYGHVNIKTGKRVPGYAHVAPAEEAMKQNFIRILKSKIGG